MKSVRLSVNKGEGGSCGSHKSGGKGSTRNLQEQKQGGALKDTYWSEQKVETCSAYRMIRLYLLSGAVKSGETNIHVD